MTNGVKGPLRFANIINNDRNQELYDFLKQLSAASAQKRQSTGRTRTEFFFLIYDRTRRELNMLV